MMSQMFSLIWSTNTLLSGSSRMATRRCLKMAKEGRFGGKWFQQSFMIAYLQQVTNSVLPVETTSIGLRHFYEELDIGFIQ